MIIDRLEKFSKSYPNSAVFLLPVQKQYINKIVGLFLSTQHINRTGPIFIILYSNLVNDHDWPDFLTLEILTWDALHKNHYYVMLPLHCLILPTP